jgi:uncharacterized damage-inducible protein DinB
MMESIKRLLVRDLNKLKEEVTLFTNENDLWISPTGLNNSAGNLCLHICGNLNHFIGAVLGNSDYQRNREKEFVLKNVPAAELILEIEKTEKTVIETIENFDGSLLKENYPINVFGDEMTTEYFLIHLVSHLNYHLGQINYLRRIIIE